MILLDVNLLLYAVNEDAPLHRQTKRWLESAMSGSETIGFAWIVLLAFLRITTRQGVFRKPLTPEAAFELISGWLEQPNAAVVHPGANHLRVLRELLLPIGMGGNLTSDAHLAALAIEHGAEVCSGDNDFSRFKGLRWSNPLA
jgi:toxin-antitoxin system PIN domain toxin